MRLPGCESIAKPFYKWKVRMKDLRTDNEDEKEVDLPFDSLVAALNARGIAPLR